MRFGLPFLLQDGGDGVCGGETDSSSASAAGSSSSASCLPQDLTRSSMTANSRDQSDSNSNNLTISAATCFSEKFLSVTGLRNTDSSLFTTEVFGSSARPCPYCGKMFQGTWHLRRHLRTHTGERPFCCPYCPYRATQSGDLKRHVNGMHREQQSSLPPQFL